VWHWELDLDEAAGSMRSRDMCELMGKWVKPTCQGATGREKKDA